MAKTPPQTKISSGGGKFAAALRGLLNKINPLAYSKRTTAKRLDDKALLLQRKLNQQEDIKIKRRFNPQRFAQKMRRINHWFVPGKSSAMKAKTLLASGEAQKNSLHWLTISLIQSKIGLQLWANQMMIQNTKAANDDEAEKHLTLMQKLRGKK